MNKYEKGPRFPVGSRDDDLIATTVRIPRWIHTGLSKVIHDSGTTRRAFYEKIFTEVLVKENESKR